MNPQTELNKPNEDKSKLGDTKPIVAQTELEKQIDDLLDMVYAAGYKTAEYHAEGKSSGTITSAALWKAKQSIFTLTAKADREARISELKQLEPPEQYEDYAKLMGDEMCHTCGFNACKFRRLLQDRINQLNGDK